MASFTCQGGSLRYDKVFLTREDLIAFRDLYREEADAAFRACPISENGPYEAAVVLLAQVVFALDQHDKWVRAQCSSVAESARTGPFPS